MHGPLIPPSDWYDWVAVHRTLTERDKVGRYLSREEKLMVARAVIERGSGLGEFLRIARTSHSTARGIWVEAGGEL